MKYNQITALIPLLVLPAMAENLIISNNATSGKTIQNNILSPTGSLSASDVFASMASPLFVKSTREGREEFGNGASLASVACSMSDINNFRYELTWTNQVNTQSGHDAFTMTAMTIDWAMLRLHNNTVVGTVTYDGEGVLHNYDLSFNYELKNADGSQTWASSTPVTVSIGAVAERDNHMCSNSGSIYKDGINLTDTPETVMSATRSEVVFGDDVPVILRDDSTYTLTLTLAGITDRDTGLPFELNTDVRTRYGLGVANEWTYAAVGNVAFTGEVGPQPVPEPATATVGLLALAGLASRRRRR